MLGHFLTVDKLFFFFSVITYPQCRSRLGFDDISESITSLLLLLLSKDRPDLTALNELLCCQLWLLLLSKLLLLLTVIIAVNDVDIASSSSGGGGFFGTKGLFFEPFGQEILGEQRKLFKESC